MFEALGRLVVRRRRATLALFLVGLVAAGVLGSGAFSRLQSAGFEDPSSDSARAAELLRARFGVTDPAAVLAVDTPAGVDRPEAAAEAAGLVRELQAEPGVARVVSYWTAGRPAELRSTDGRAGQVLVFARSGDPGDQELGARVLEAYAGERGALTVHVGGQAVVNSAVSTAITEDLARAESIAVPLTTALLVVVFGGLVAALLPFTVAAGAVLGSFLVLYLATLGTDVSVFALNLVTGLGLGLGIDYALLVVNRFREELAAQGDVEGAVVRTVATAGRTVVVSGIAVTATMAALLAFPQYFLRSFGYAGVAVTLLAVLSTIVALPAVLALLGHRVNRLRVIRRDLTPRDTGAWATVARRVMRSPWPVLVIVLGALLTLASPARDVAFGQVDDRVLPASEPAAAGSAVLRERFAGDEGAPAEVVVPGARGAAVAAPALADYAAELSRVPGVVRVVTPSSVVVDGRPVAANPDPGGFAAGADRRLSVVADVPARTTAGQDLVETLRSVPAPTGTVVGGAAATYADSQGAIADRLPAVLAWIGVTTLLVLFLYTGSVLLPVKAVLLNVVSLAATLGVLVWIFQEGHLRWLVGDFTVTGQVDTAMAVLIAIVAFALSMDYEVFLLSRITEEHAAGRDTEEAVVLGLQRSGRIITAAAALLAIVFVAFVSSGVTNIKQLGVGVTVAVLLDATVVRGLLVPAFMRIAGRANWWAPRRLRVLHGRFGLSEA